MPEVYLGRGNFLMRLMVFWALKNRWRGAAGKPVT